MGTIDPKGLIARIAAGEGDNAEVLRALGWLVVGNEIRKPDGIGYRPMIHPLTSVDDALRLVPEGWRTFNVFDDGSVVWWLYATDSQNSQKVQGQASTAARALTIAILRTRETTDV